jgi:hypothetical protein
MGVVRIVGNRSENLYKGRKATAKCVGYGDQ